MTYNSRGWRTDDDMPFLQDSMQTHLDYLLEENQIEVITLAKPFYSLSYCQGDGAMFEGGVKWQGNYYNIKHSGYYYHSKCKEITGHNENEEEIDTDSFDVLYTEICAKLEKLGYEEIEYLSSREAISEIFDANEYTFEENGIMNNL